jgi:RimJ/RimL family protein N-acetyltransferase
MRLETERLALAALKEDELPELLEVFLGNPQYLEWTEGGDYDLEKLKLDWHMAKITPGRHMLGLREKKSGKLVGVIEYLELNEHDGHPWIGLIMVRDERKREGFAAEAMNAVIDRLRMGWASPVRLAVIAENEPGMRLALSLGFESYGETEQRMAAEAQRLILLQRRETRSP